MISSWGTNITNEEGNKCSKQWMFPHPLKLPILCFIFSFFSFMRSKNTTYSFFVFFVFSFDYFYSQVHWLNHSFPCSQFMHKNLAWKCVLANEHGALIESKVMHWKIISRDRLQQCLVKIVMKCALERLISFAGEFAVVYLRYNLIFFFFIIKGEKKITLCIPLLLFI